jgi:hypothetical protein
VKKYQGSATLSNSKQLGNYRHRGEAIRVTNVELLVGGHPATSVLSGAACAFRVSYSVISPAYIGRELSVSIMIHNDGYKLTNLWTNYTSGRGETIAEKGQVTCQIDHWPFRDFTARLEVYTHIGFEVQDWIEDCLSFDSADGDFYNSGVVTNAGQGPIFINHIWSSQPCP